MWQLDPKKGPLYRQLAEQVVLHIIQGQLKPEEKLPSSRDLAVSAGLNPNTVIQAFQELEKMGISETKRGKGTFVRADIDIDQLRQSRIEAITTLYLNEVKALGLKAEDAVRVIEEKSA